MNGKLTLDEVKEKKKSLEAAIQMLIEDFTKETGINITYIDFKYIGDGMCCCQKVSYDGEREVITSVDSKLFDE